PQVVDYSTATLVLGLEFSDEPAPLGIIQGDGASLHGQQRAVGRESNDRRPLPFVGESGQALLACHIEDTDVVRRLAPADRGGLSRAGSAAPLRFPRRVLLRRGAASTCGDGPLLAAGLALAAPDASLDGDVRRCPRRRPPPPAREPPCRSAGT